MLASQTVCSNICTALSPCGTPRHSYPVVGYNSGGVSGPGKSGGSAISPQGWLFDICDDPERCVIDPTLGISVWFRQLWQVQLRFQGLSRSAEARRPGASRQPMFTDPEPCKLKWSPWPSIPCAAVQDPGYRTLVAQRWAVFRAGPWSDAAVGGLISGAEAALQPAGLRTLNKCG